MFCTKVRVQLKGLAMLILPPPLDSRGWGKIMITYNTFTIKVEAKNIQRRNAYGNVALIV